jgi:hypothetical protein
VVVSLFEESVVVSLFRSPLNNIILYNIIL